jgi:hypothetical protein
MVLAVPCSMLDIKAVASNNQEAKPPRSITNLSTDENSAPPYSFFLVKVHIFVAYPRRPIVLFPPQDVLPDSTCMSRQGSTIRVPAAFDPPPFAAMHLCCCKSLPIRLVLPVCSIRKRCWLEPATLAMPSTLQHSGICSFVVLEVSQRASSGSTLPEYGLPAATA